MKLDKLIGRISFYIPENKVKDELRKFYHFKILKKSVIFALSQDKLIIYKDGKKFNFDYGILAAGKNEIEIAAFEGYLSKYFPKEGDVIVDCGAYIGVFTSIVSKLVGRTGKVIAIEADPMNFKILKHMKEKLNLKNVIIINSCILDRNGIVDFHCKSGKASSIYDSYKQNDKIKVKSSTLDNELEKIGIDKINFLKVDVEGAEIELLKGAQNILTNSRAEISVASYHIVNEVKTFKRVEEILKEFGYKIKTGNKNHLTTYGWK